MALRLPGGVLRADRRCAFARRRPRRRSSRRRWRCSRAAKRPLIVAGGGVLYSEGGADALRRFAEAHGVPVAETQAGKSALPWDHPLQAGPIGVTGGTAANALAREADVVIARRHAPAGLHDRLALAVRAGAHASASTSTRSTRSSGARCHAASPTRARRSMRCRRRLAGWTAGPGVAGQSAVREAVAWRDDRLPHRRRARNRAARASLRRRSDRRGAALASGIRRRTTSSSARRARCRASCTSSGARRGRAATTSSTATRAWATRSPAASASRWRGPSAK